MLAFFAVLGQFGALVATTPSFATSVPPSVEVSGLPEGTAVNHSLDRFAATEHEQMRLQKGWADKLQRGRGANRMDNDPFSSRTWIAPPKAAAVAPSVPVFPFRFIGKMMQEGAPPKLFLERADRLYTVSPGQVLDGNYRVDVIGETSFEVTYLPLEKKQRLAYAEITPPPTNYAQPVAPLPPLAGARESAGRPESPQAGFGATASLSAFGGTAPARPSPVTPPLGTTFYGPTARVTPHAPTAVQPPSGSSSAQLAPQAPVPVQLSPHSPAPVSQMPQGPAAAK